MYQTGPTIKQTLDDIQSNKIVLPAIQREFVWRPRQVCDLFDSLMQGYLIGSFLFWKVEPEYSSDFQFYGFVRDHHQRNNPHNPRLLGMQNKQLTAVLDGQQRLTALNIGLRGSMSWKLPYKWWNNPSAFPKRRLYLDLLWQPDDDNPTGLEYRFDFLTAYRFEHQSENECWFPVSGMLGTDTCYPTEEWLKDKISYQGDKYVPGALDKVRRLHDLVYIDKPFSYYEESSQQFDKVIQIFIRLNNNGTALSYSDMLLSIVAGQWSGDARKEVHSLVDELNRIGAGFSFSKDQVLKAALMLSDIRNIGFKVDNFGRESMHKVESNWNDIKRALNLSVTLLSDFGFSGRTLSARNALLPIAYYLYVSKHGKSYLTSKQFEHDRLKIHQWLVRSLLKPDIWRDSVDGLLTALRNIIKSNVADGFPLFEIYEEMRNRRKSLDFENGDVDGLLDLEYGEGRTFVLLSQIFPFVDLSKKLNIDHVFPVAQFDQASDDRQRINKLANLQLLTDVDNKSKGDTMPAEWLRKSHPDDASRQPCRDGSAHSHCTSCYAMFSDVADCTLWDMTGKNHIERHLLGKVPECIAEFGSFFDARRERLKVRIAELLGRHPAPAEAAD